MDLHHLPYKGYPNFSLLFIYIHFQHFTLPCQQVDLFYFRKVTMATGRKTNEYSRRPEMYFHNSNNIVFNTASKPQLTLNATSFSSEIVLNLSHSRSVISTKTVKKIYIPLFCSQYK